MKVFAFGEPTLSCHSERSEESARGCTGLRLAHTLANRFFASLRMTRVGAFSYPWDFAFIRRLTCVILSSAFSAPLRFNKNLHELCAFAYLAVRQ